ncbi:MAG: 2-amino-4-hydroxy-6-hydroxymethyldihydropteridine diphosphokinase [Acidimicrobiia bacterium]|nr:2-amino-4-hydroxy-6-hydroxymethyldihydropteridine diphosphokinase [Acidimicrobiia bacterium]MCC5954361.1 2-amino-4-hydroxy-6-hydroxymethyldihydropteridine diphosphokinase [Acidimicrobiia bacterium]
MTRAYLGLGSNLGDRRGHLLDAVRSLVSVSAVSNVYETEPMGGPSGQDAYLNVVVQLETELTPRALLGVCHRLETAAGRVRSERWGPRTLDVDILWMEGVSIVEPDLQIPHPRLWERRFVLAPLADVAPELVSDEALEAAEGRVSDIGPLGIDRNPTPG